MQNRFQGRIGVLMGGCSSERPISLKSGKAVLSALHNMSCDCVAIDIDTEDEQDVRTLIQNADLDIAFVVLHGRFGEDGKIQKVLDGLNIAHTGSPREAHENCFNKAVTQGTLKEHALPVLPFFVISKDSQWDHHQMVENIGGYPLIVKPVKEGSSFGVHIVNQPGDLDEALKNAFAYGPNVLIEKYVNGRELTVGILDEEALPVIEICPKSTFFDYKAKYNKGMTDYVVPAEISEELTSDLQNSSLAAHKIMGCEGFSRVDFMLDQQNKFFILEVNTIPGFTETSLVPMAAQAVGISFDRLCLKLINIAYAEKKAAKSQSINS